MLCSTIYHPPALMAHKSFNSLMDLYEQNYMKLKRLIPELDNINAVATSVSKSCLDLNLEIIERSKYTTTILLTYHFSQDDRFKMEPNLQIRIYHDAKVAAVMSGVIHNHHYQLDDSSSELEKRWHLNRFLSKWLSYCLLQGHYFKSVSKKIEYDF